MILVGASWLWIGLSAFCVGYAVLFLLNKLNGCLKMENDMILMTGLCFLTVYAQFFSLIYKVGAAATVLLLCIILIILFGLRKSIRNHVEEIFAGFRREKWMLAVLAGLTAALVIITSGEAIHYDTALYHGQSIRWIEDYGIVPGLGNLHNRLAYNSSSFCLQALFSMKFLVNQSLHSVNGFVTLVLLGYALCTLKAPRQGKFFTSDFLRLGLIIFLNDAQNYRLISSPGSDHLALGLVFYILIKWISYWEDGEKQEAPYVYLCLLAVFDVSVKLSAAMIVLPALIPAISLVRKRKWKEIFWYVFAGLVIILPFLARNVIISGYLLYPYPELDLFNVDWKMPAYTLTFDRNEIKAWGWGLDDVRLFDTPFMEWFPYWYSNLTRWLRVLFVINIPAAFSAVVYGIYRGVKKDWRILWFVSAVAANFILWFAAAPLVRYGSAYMLLMPLLVMGRILSRESEKRKCSAWKAAAVIIALGSYCMHPILQYSMNCEWRYLKRSADYADYICTEYKLEDETIYVPAGGDQAGYYTFPSTPYAGRLNLIELRGKDLSEGFRMKEEYRKAFVTTYGQVDETDMFSGS